MHLRGNDNVSADNASKDREPPSAPARKLDASAAAINGNSHKIEGPFPLPPYEIVILSFF